MLKEPVSGSPETGFWKVCNSMVIQWILNTVDKSIESSISYGESVTAKVIWDGLREHFCVGNGSKVHELKGKIATIRQRGSSIVDYFTRLTAMWNELSNCTHTSCCTCGATADYARNNDEEKLHQFLLGLNDSIFGTICA